MQCLISCAVLIGAANCVLVAGGFHHPRWESPAHWHRTLRRAIPGTLAIDSEGVEFRSKEFSHKWPFLEIHTFDVSDRDLTLTTYENRPWHEPGEKRFHFTLEQNIPAAVASALAVRVDRPVRNDAPDKTAPAIAEIPARHKERFGGSNGLLRFRESGIDYVTPSGRDSRSWRWSDIQTVASPNRYTLRVTAYREIAEFELKRPLTRALFDRLWDKLYAAGLNISADQGGQP